MFSHSSPLIVSLLLVFLIADYWHDCKRVKQFSLVSVVRDCLNHVQANKEASNMQPAL